MERGRQLSKHPLCWVRNKMAPWQLSIKAPLPPASGENHATKTDEVPPSEKKWMVEQAEMPRGKDPSSSSTDGDVMVPEITQDANSTDWWLSPNTMFTLVADMDLFDEPSGISLSHRKNASCMWNMEESWLPEVFEAASVKPESNVSREQSELEEEILANQDPSRISPKAFLRLPKCIEAIQKELDDLTKKGPTGIPSLIAVSLQNPLFAKLPRACTTMVVKRENPALFKARMCIRGDQQMGRDEFATSAPTAARAIPKILISISRATGWGILMVDISQAFLPSSLIIPSQRILIYPPEYIPCPWFGSVDLKRGEKTRRTTHAFLTMRPLYETSAAPLRWHTKLSEMFVRYD